MNKDLYVIYKKRENAWYVEQGGQNIFGPYTDKEDAMEDARATAQKKRCEVFVQEDPASPTRGETL